MPLSRLASSVLLLAYMVVVAANAIPAPGPSSADTAGSTRLLQHALFRAAWPIRSLTERFIVPVIPQRWDMFSSPRNFEQYVRLTYYVESSGKRNLKLARELVYPILANEDIRLSYVSRDKAVDTALERFLSSKSSGLSDQANGVNLRPVTRYFATQYIKANSAASTAIARTEFWYGQAPIPASGTTLPSKVWQDRLDVLRDYQNGPWVTLFAGTYPRVSTMESEADIVWQLEYIDQR